jgi:succinoglycan biosynthesis protein ExoA
MTADVAPPSSRPEFTVSVVIITQNRLESLRACLAGLEAAEEPRPREIVVIVNGPDPATREWLTAASGRNGRLKWSELAVPSKGKARNEGARLASGDFVYFLDDDAVPVPRFFQILREKQDRYPDAQVLGGPNLTPDESGAFQRSVGYVLESRWGAGRMRARYRGVGEDHAVDDRSLILCNLVIRRSLFQEGAAAFHQSLFYNEENLLLDRLRRRGVRMMYCPDLAVRHARRNSWAAFLRQVWHSGVGRGMMTRMEPRSLRPDFLAPSLLLFCVLSAPFAKAVAWVPLLGYAVIIAGHAAGYRRLERGLRPVARVFFLTAGAHLVYGAGFCRGLVKSARR